MKKPLLIALALALILALLCGCGPGVEYIDESGDGAGAGNGATDAAEGEPGSDGGSPSDDDNGKETEMTPHYVPNELIGMFSSKGDAEEAAELYEIELSSYENEIAVFTCEEGQDPQTLINQGKENGWPELSLNYVYTAF